MSHLMFDLLLNKTLTITLLVLLILVVRPVLLKFLNAKATYLFWASVPVTLLLPIDFITQEVNVPIMTFFAGTGESVVNLKVFSLPKQFNHVSYIIIIWLLGFIMSMSFYIIRYQLLKRSLRGNHRHLQQVASDKQLKSVEIVNSSLVNVPAVFGFIKAYLILPTDFSSYTRKQQHIILSHEKVHLSRGDHRFNVLRTLIKGLFWFNPLIYYADRFVEVDQELSCDFEVINSAEQFGLRQYGEALLNAISRESKASLVSQWNYTNLIRVRLKMLKNTTQKKWHTLAATLIAISSIWSVNSVIGSEEQSAQTAEPIQVVQPGYPRTAAKQKIQGSVTLRFDLNEQGKVLNAQVVESTPAGVFDESALKAFKQWHFATGEKRSNLRYTMNFQL